MDTFRHTSWRAFGVLVVLFLHDSAMLAQSVPGIVARRGADVHGSIEGALQVTDEGEVQIAPGASITGELIVPAEKRGGNSSVKDEKNGIATPSSKTLVKNRGSGSAIGGDIRAVDGFELPHVHPPKEKRGTETKIVAEQYVAALDFTKIGDFTVKHPRARISLPPDAYGNFIVSEGTLVLGYSGVTDTIRYDFQRLQIDSRARIEVLSPVIVSIADGSSWLGAFGDNKTVFWLDVRVAHGDVLLGPGAEFHGHLSAPQSRVTISQRALFVGGLVSDRMVVEDGAKVVARDPIWDADTTNRAAPTLAHRALRLQREVPKLRAASKSRYFPGVSYIEDVPYVMLARGGTPGEGDGAAEYEHEAVFNAFRAVFAESGFARAGVVLASTSADGGVPSVRNLALTRAQFETLVSEIGGKGSAAEKLQAVSTSSALREQFIQRVAALSAAGRPAR